MKVTITTDLDENEAHKALTRYILEVHKYKYSHPLHNGKVEAIIPLSGVIDGENRIVCFRVIWGEAEPEKVVPPPSPESLARLVRECEEPKAEAL